MTTATLTSKGQTTIPLEIRSYLGLHTGDKLIFIIEKKRLHRRHEPSN